MRIFIPYLLIAVPITLPRYLLNGYSLADWLLFISTVDYWISHHGVWFLAAIIPLYLIAPFVFRLICRFGVWICVFPILVFYMTGFINEDSDVLNNILFVTVRIPAFFLGMMLGKYVKAGSSVPIGYILCTLLMALIMLATTRRLVYTYIFLVIPIAWIGSALLIRFVRPCLEFMGDISLESYLTNVIFPVSIVAVPLSCIGIADNSWIVYTLFAVSNVLSAYLYHLISNKIIKNNG